MILKPETPKTIQTKSHIILNGEQHHYDRKGKHIFSSTAAIGDQGLERYSTTAQKTFHKQELELLKYFYNSVIWPEVRECFLEGDRPGQAEGFLSNPTFRYFMSPNSLFNRLESDYLDNIRLEISKPPLDNKLATMYLLSISANGETLRARIAKLLTVEELVFTFVEQTDPKNFKPYDYPYTPEP